MESKPASTIRRKTMLEIIVGMKARMLESDLMVTQARSAGTQTERNYGLDKPSGSKIYEIGH